MEYPTLDIEATGNRIRELRKKRKLKVEEVADFMGFESTQAVYKWQRGDSLPTVENLYALSRLLDTPIEGILVGNEREEDATSSSQTVDKVRGNALAFLFSDRKPEAGASAFEFRAQKRPGNPCSA